MDKEKMFDEKNLETVKEIGKGIIEGMKDKSKHFMK